MIIKYGRLYETDSFNKLLELNQKYWKSQMLSLSFVP